MQHHEATAEGYATAGAQIEVRAGAEVDGVVLELTHPLRHPSGLLATLRALPGARADPVVLAGGLLAAGPLRARIESAVRISGFAAEPVRGATRAAAAAVGIDLPV